MDLGPFVESGLYDPQAAHAEQRRELIEHLLGRGFTAEQILYAAARVSRPTNVATALTRPLPKRLSLRELAERTGTTVEEVAALRSALGFPVLAEDVPDVFETYVDDVALYLAACDQYGREATLGFVRVVGSAVLTMTEAGRELFATPLRRAAATELQVSQANEISIAAWDALQQVVAHVMVDRTSRDTWFETALLTGELVLAVAFIDLVDSTPWTASSPPPEHAAALARFELTAHELATAHSARVVKFIGDEAMIVARNPNDAAAIALDLCAAATDDPMLPSARAAIAYGPVTARDGDYFGQLVNLASRATKAAEPGHVVVTRELADHLDGSSWALSNARSVELRGVEGMVGLLEVQRRMPTE